MPPCWGLILMWLSAQCVAIGVKRGLITPLLTPPLQVNDAVSVLMVSSFNLSDSLSPDEKHLFLQTRKGQMMICTMPFSRGVTKATEGRWHIQLATRRMRQMHSGSPDKNQSCTPASIRVAKPTFNWDRPEHTCIQAKVRDVTHWCFRKHSLRALGFLSLDTPPYFTCKQTQIAVFYSLKRPVITR